MRRGVKVVEMSAGNDLRRYDRREIHFHDVNVRMVCQHRLDGALPVVDRPALVCDLSRIKGTYAAGGHASASAIG